MAVALQSNMIMNAGTPRVVVLSATQSAMIKAALSQYGGHESEKVEKPEPTKVSRGLDSQGERAPGEHVGGSRSKETGSQTLDSSVRRMIGSAISAYRSGSGGRSFAQIMMAELQANGVDGSQSSIDYYV